MQTITIVYNEGQGFTEIKREYESLQDAISREGHEIINARIYKNGKQIA